MGNFKRNSLSPIGSRTRCQRAKSLFYHPHQKPTPVFSPLIRFQIFSPTFQKMSLNPL